METNKNIGAAECGDCNTCNKCDEKATRNEINNAFSVAVPKKSGEGVLLSHDGLTLYTMLIYSENFAGILNQITAVFTRRQVNIESLNVCASSTPGVHKYTITCYCTEDMAIMLTKQIEKKIDVLDEEIFILEACLMKLSTPKTMENPEVSRIIRSLGARIVEVNPTYSILEKKGGTEDILSLFNSLNELGVVLQFVRSGRIAVTKSTVEKLDRYLEQRESEK